MRIKKIEVDKIQEFVEDGLTMIGGRLLAVTRKKDIVSFEVADCEVSVLEDVVNQRMGHYAYPWTSWAKSGTELEVGLEEYED